jgi:phosphatidylserine decarboxylase
MAESTVESGKCEPRAVDRRVDVEPLDASIDSIQPGGGFCMRVELAWGALRRGCLRLFRRGYIERMADVRQGEDSGCPHPVLDPRDVKFYRNQGGYHWRREDDPFTWRDRLPFARVGLAELILMCGTCLILTVVAAWLWWPASFVPAILGVFFLSFFRDPRRSIPGETGAVVAPADGKIVEVVELDHDEFIGGPAVMIGIFLSVFNVHINRTPVAARVIGLTYRRGKFLNALRAVSARENEQMAVRLEESVFPHRRMVVRQIAGALARRIVCWVAPGEELERGEQFGMIKLGSRTELLLPRESGLDIQVQIGQHVKAGTSIVARYAACSATETPQEQEVGGHEAD